MNSSKPLCLPLLLLIAATSWQPVRAAVATPVDFSGVWRLDEQHSDSPSDIAQRLRAEEKREQPAAAGNATAAAGAPASARRGSRGGSHGMGGGGMGGGGHGHGGSRSHDRTDDADGGAAAADVPPPLLADDAILNVQQGAKTIRVAVGDKDQLDGRLDGIVSQSLNGNAMVQSHLTAGGLEFSMQFDGEVRLRQDWSMSADGHHLVVVESWTTPAVQQPIVFRRSYDRLDI